MSNASNETYGYFNWRQIFLSIWRHTSCMLLTFIIITAFIVIFYTLNLQLINEICYIVHILPYNYRIRRDVSHLNTRPCTRIELVLTFCFAKSMSYDIEY